MKRLSMFVLSMVLCLGLVFAPAWAADADRELPEGQDRVMIPVAGMTCGECAESIDRSVKKLDGIVDIEVDHLEGAVTVVRVTDKVTIDQIVEAINKTGFKASRPDKG